MLAREDAVGIGCKLHEQRELLLRQRDLPAAHDRAARGTVDDELAEIDELAARRATAQDRVDPRDELLVDERAGQVVVAALECADLRIWVGPSEHDHGAIRDTAAVELVRIAEHEDVGLRRPREIACAREGQHVEAVARELALEEAAHRRFGFREQQCCHARDASHARERAPDVLSRDCVTFL